jgi:pantothenate synthetase
MKHALPKNLPQTVGLLGFKSKHPQGSQHHEGHEYIIQQARQQCDILVAMYTRCYTYINLLEENEVPEDDPFDQDYCTTFCQNNNVDIVYLINTQEIKQGTNKQQEKERIKNITNNVKTHQQITDWVDLAFKGSYLFHKHSISNWKKDKIFHSVSDGYLRFLQRAFYAEHNLPEIVLIPPLKRVDGLTPSSSLLKLTPEEVTIVQKIPILINQFLQHQSERALYTALRDVDSRSNPTIVFQHFNLVIGDLLGANNLLITVHYGETNASPIPKITINEFFTNPWNK